MSHSPLEPQQQQQTQTQTQPQPQSEFEKEEQELTQINDDNNNNKNNNISPNKSKPHPRLVLTQIELENFKSYYGRRVIGPFHKRFSSIVGPNGSGKSNVIDALLFVFGRRASQIRLKRISELVHTSSNHPNCKQARVNIYFQDILDNEDHENQYTVIPNSEICISRIATKSNKSQYLINNKTSKISKVKELLLSKGIDLNNNRFLILQGEVESIAMMKPKSMSNNMMNNGKTVKNDDGLLEYLEDIIGSNKYILQINKCSEQCDTLNNEVQERLNRVKIVERDRDKLSDAKDEAINYIKSQLQLYKLQGIQKQLFINKYNNKAEALNKSLVKFNNNITEKEEKRAQTQQEMQEIEEKYQQIKKEKIEVGKQVKKGNSEFQTFEQMDVSFSERLKYLKKEITKIKRNRNKLEKTKVECDDKISKNEKLIPELESELEELQNDLNEQQNKQERMMAELTDKIQPIKEAMEEKQKQLIPLKDRENGIKQELDIINNNINAINNKVTDAQQRKQDIVNRINDINININNQNNKLNNEIENDINTHQQNKINMNQKTVALKDEEKKLQIEINNQRKEYQDMRHSFQNASRSNNRIVGLLLKAQEKGDLTGILGRLGDLGSIDIKYDVAASTAATAALNYIVVEKTHHAQRAVEYLKRHNLGRATMLILDKQRHYQRSATRKIQTPNNVARLYDLIRFKEPRFNVAFYFVFRDTLVANNLTQANNLAFSGGKRWRVVTLQGQLIETSGAMTGGGNKVYRGLMSDRIIENENNHCTERQLADKGKELDGMEKRLSEIRGEIRNIRAELKQCQKKMDKLMICKRKLRMEINGLEQRKCTLQEQIPAIDASAEMSENDMRNLNELEEEKKEKTEVFLSAQHDSELLEDAIADLEEKILESGGNSLREQKSKIDKLKRKLKNKSKLVTKLGVEIKTAHKKLKSSGKKLQSMENNENEMREERDEVKNKKKDLEEKALELMEELKKKEALYEEKEAEYKKLNKIVEKRSLIITKLTKEIFEEEEKRKNINTELEQTQHKIKKVKTEWQGLENKYQKNKNEFLEDEELENNENINTNTNNNNTNNGMEVDTDNETVAVVDHEMDIDNDGETEAETEVEQHDSEEKAMEVNENSIKSLAEYTSENTFIFEMLSSTQLHEIDPSQIAGEIDDIKSELQTLQVNMGAISAYRKKDSEYVEKLKDLQTCKSSRDTIRREYENCKKLRFDSFMCGFSEITRKLKEMYRMLTCGGDAELELVDSIDPFSEGVQFSVRPPKKSWKNISNLSGGEKTLSSMALVFALHHYKPTPLYVMDEIDAALDFKNVSIVANYIHQRTKNAQFVIISLRNNMFELANRLVGIYKTNNASKSITIDPKLFKLPKSNQNNNNQINHNQNINVNVNHNQNINEQDEDDDILLNNEKIINHNIHNIQNNNHSNNNNNNDNDMIEID